MSNRKIRNVLSPGKITNQLNFTDVELDELNECEILAEFFDE